MTKVFVYGTLKPGGRYHREYCGPFDFETRAARVKGRLYDFPTLGYPGAEEFEGSSISGNLIHFFHPEKEVLKRLDILEGFEATRASHLNEYYRKAVETFDDADARQSLGTAWCYFMDPTLIHRLGGVIIPGGYWPVMSSPA